MTSTTGTAANARICGLRQGSPAELIAGFTHGFSLEATRPTGKDLAALAGVAPPGTRIYLSAVATHPPDEVVEIAKAVRALGFAPVPHLAVRMFANAAALDDVLARLTGEAAVDRALVIGGDRAQPAGEFRSAIELIDGGMLRRRGIAEIGVAGYPQGHPRLSQQDLDRALFDKIAAAEATGIRAHIVTQFCFDVGAILAWIGRLRDFGLEHPVRVGLAGPASLTTLLRYAQRCGVQASALGLAKQAGLVRHLLAMSTPDTLVRPLAEAAADGALGAVKPHFYSFGGLPGTARWAAGAAAGRIVLEAGERFRVEPDGRFG